MAAIETVRNPSIYLLRDHLDAALAMGEDLLTETLALDTPAGKSPLRTWMRQNRDLNDFLTSTRTLEYAMTTRLLQARKRAEEVKRSESRLKPLVALFVAGTAPLVDAAAELGDTDARDFNSADAALTFLRTRGLLASDAAGLEGLTRLAVSEDYQIAGAHPARHVAGPGRHVPRHARSAVRSQRRACRRPGSRQHAVGHWRQCAR